jgi:hypothetical protein
MHWVPAYTMFRRTKKYMKVQRKKAVTMTTGDEQERSNIVRALRKKGVKEHQ